MRNEGNGTATVVSVCTSQNHEKWIRFSLWSSPQYQTTQFWIRSLSSILGVIWPNSIFKNNRGGMYKMSVNIYWRDWTLTENSVEWAPTQMSSQESRPSYSTFTCDLFTSSLDTRKQLVKTKRDLLYEIAGFIEMLQSIYWIELESVVKDQRV